MIHPFTKKLLLLYLLVVAAGVFTMLASQNIESRRALVITQSGTQTPPAVGPATLPDGTLVRALGDAKVYYIENGLKRPIQSEDVFRLHGLLQEDIVYLSAGDLARYREGEAVLAQTNLILPEERDVLPDLAPFAAQDLRLSKVNGRTVLRFTTSFWNKGKQEFKLIADQSPKTESADSLHDVFQHIESPDKKAYRNKTVGNFLWHTIHNHYHYDDFVDYVLDMVRPASGSLALDTPTVKQKTTFCMRDDKAVDLGLNGAPSQKVFGKCGLSNQGVSVGWADVYSYTLPDQYLDVQDMPAGIYQLSFFVDPNQRFVESRKDNNISIALMNLDPRKGILKVIATGTAFSAGGNSFPDKMLIRSGGGGEIYVIHNNKKRWLRSAEIFDSYGYDWNAIFTLPQSIVEFIPSNNLIRLAGTQDVYALSDLGYRRHILTPAVLTSYQLTGRDIANISQAEFASYPESKLIMLFGGADVYEITGTTKRLIGSIGSLDALGHDPDSIHVINSSDFNEYLTTP